MTLNIFTSIKDWFVDVYRTLARIFKPIADWFYETVEPVRDFIVENARNPFLWVGIIVVALIIFEITFKALNKDRG